MERTSKRIGVLNGYRAFAILLVMIFHLWQQSWQGGISYTLFSRRHEFPPRSFFASGSAWVDVLILLSGFLLFLPYAGEMFGDRPVNVSAGRFYQKRFARLAPSVYLHLAVLAIFLVRPSDYDGNVFRYLGDLIRNLLFMQDVPIEALGSSHYTGTLWTLTVEVFFYLIFPLLAPLFKRQPYLTAIGMIGLSEAFIHANALPQFQTGYTLPHRMFPAYLGVYAVGMLCAIAYQQLDHSEFKRKKLMTLFSTLIALLFLFLTCYLVWHGYGNDTTVVWQVENRLMLASFAGIAMVALCFSWRGLQLIFDNPLTKVLADISFNMYIWHQFFSVYLKKWHIPAYPDYVNGAPQMNSFPGQEAWRIKYLLCVWCCTILVSLLVTYLIEKPCSKLILRAKKGEPHEQIECKAAEKQ